MPGRAPAKALDGLPGLEDFTRLVGIGEVEEIGRRFPRG